MAKYVMATSVFAMLWVTACMPAATDDELNQMCDNLVKLRGEISKASEKELIAAEEERFKKEEIRLKEWKARDLKGWDEELEAKLAEAKKDDEKEALKAEYAKKKAITASKHDPDINALDGKKKEAIEAAKKKAKENEADWEAAVQECIDKAKAQGITQKVAQCRITADSVDHYWNRCR